MGLQQRQEAMQERLSRRVRLQNRKWVSGARKDRRRLQRQLQRPPIAILYSSQPDGLVVEGMQWCAFHDEGAGRMLPQADFYTKGRNRCKVCFRAYKNTRYDAYGETLATKYGQTASQAARRGLEFSLTLQEYANLMSLPCVYGQKSVKEIRVGIDRRDNTQGYTPANSQPCCARHNQIKSNVFTHEEMLLIIASCPSAGACDTGHGGKQMKTGQRINTLVRPSESILTT